uniref:hypothetical protein n=1 Tax=Tessaracoccus bendigoensis TaxID=72764 RepID=UPI001C31DF0C
MLFLVRVVFSVLPVFVAVVVCVVLLAARGLLLVGLLRMSGTRCRRCCLGVWVGSMWVGGMKLA